MKVKYFENSKTSRPTIRLTFSDEEEYETFVQEIKEKSSLIKEADSDALENFLERLTKKKRTTVVDGVESPVTYINTEDFYSLTLAFIELLNFV